MRRLVATLAVLLLVTATHEIYADDAPEGTPDEPPPAPVITKAPKLAKFVEAVYPPGEKAAGKQASVVLQIEIGADGHVGAVTVEQTAGAAFDAAAVAAARQFVFEPAEIDHKPAPVKISYKYDFVIHEEVVELKHQINFEGVVLERFTKKPMAKVKVVIKDLGAEGETNEDGAFAFEDVPPGKHQVELSAAELITTSTEEELVKGKKKTVKYLVEKKEEGVDEEVVVRAPRIKKESVETSIRTEEARRVPGTSGDTLKVVQNLPGVGRSSFGSGNLVVWGSAPRDTRVNIDGVEIPTLYHVGGLRSVVSSDLVKSIDLSPGAYGADYGRGLGGLVRVETQHLPKEGTHGFVAADVIDSSAMVSVTASKRIRLGLAGRLSYLDRTLKLVSSKDVGEFVPIPRYHDVQAELTAQLRPDEDLTAFWLYSDDQLTRSIAADDPAAVRTETTHSSFHRGFARYSRILPGGASFSVTPSVGYDASSSEAHFGPVPTRLDDTAWRVGLRGGYRSKLSRYATLSAGVDFQATDSAVSRVGSINLPAREGDVTVFGQPPGDDVTGDRWHALIASVAPYAFTELTFGRLGISPGLRIEPFLIDGDRLTPPNGITPGLGYRRLELAVDPRISASYRATRRLSLRVGAGLYHQAPDPEDLSAVFGNPTLGLSRALHFTAGGAYKLTGTLSFELVGFFKQLDALASRSASPTPALARALVNDGVGRSYGGQVLLRQQLYKGFFGWITYSLIRSERRDHPGDAYRTFDYDQTHVLSLLASYALGKGWEAGGRFRFATGVPRTPVVGAYYDIRDDVFQPVFGAHNSIRVPAFYQLDLRLERNMVLGGYKVNAFLDVQNVLNRKNPEEIVYSFDFAKRATISGLPTLAVIGARVEF